MASFTDIVPQFTPYIQQAPVQALVEVGMEKQRRYDEGIQKIQASIDNVAGIPVVTDLQRQYLQSKLDQLGSKLKTVAAGDFSNYQLVNSVSGMTSQIIKDPIIRAAASSATNIAKQEEFMNEERKKGNLTPDNEYNYRKAFDAYTKSGLTDESGKPIVFNKDYIAHFDVDKYVRETFDAVKPGNYTFEQLYETDENGNVRYEEVKDKTGRVISRTPKVSKIATVLEQEGRFPPEVQATLNQIFSDPRVKQQLQITGEYNYRAYTPEMLTGKFASVKDQQLKGINDRLAELNMKKAAGEDVQSDIDKLEEAADLVESQFNQVAEAIRTSPDAVRGSMYMDEVKGNWTRMYGTVSEKRTAEKNELYAMNFELQKEANDLEIRKEDMRYKWATLAETKKKNLDEKQREEFELKQKYPLAFPEVGPMKTGALNANAEFDKNYDKAAGVYGGAVDNLLFNTVLNNPKNKAAIKKYTDAGMSEEEAKSRIINNFAKSNGETPEDFRARWFTKATSYLSQNQEKLDPQVLSDLQSAQNAQTVFRTFADAKKQIDAKTPEDYKQLTKSLKPITVDTRTIFGKLYGSIIPQRVKDFFGMSGGTITLTPQQQYDLAIATSGDRAGQSAAVRAEAKAAQDRLAASGIDKDLAETISKNLAGKLTTGSETLDRYIGMSPVGNIIGTASLASQSAAKMDPSKRAYSNLVEAIGNPSTVTNLEKRAKAISEVYQFNPVAKTGIITGKEETDKVYRDAIGRFIGNYAQLGVNESPGFVDNAPAMMQIINDKKGSVEMEAKKDEVTGEVKQVLKFYNEKAQFVGEMTIDGYEAATLGKNPSSYFTMPGVKVAEIRFNSTGNGTTSFTGNVKDPNTYLGNDVLYNKDQFPLLKGQLPKGIDVRANISSTTSIDADGNPSTQYYNHLFINNNGQILPVKTFGAPKPNIDQAIQALNGINMQLIQQVIAENKSRK